MPEENELETAILAADPATELAVGRADAEDGAEELD